MTTPKTRTSIEEGAGQWVSVARPAPQEKCDAIQIPSELLKPTMTDLPITLKQTEDGKVSVVDINTVYEEDLSDE